MVAHVAVGVVGCGYWAQRHLAAWRNLQASGADLVAVCDADAGRARAAAECFGALRWYDDAAVMLAEERLGLLDVATRMDTHRALARAAVAARVPVIVQKPMAPAFADCRVMVEAARAAGVWFAVHENFRFQPAMLKTAEVLADGAIGAPSWGRLSFRTGVDVYKTQPYFLHEERLAILDVGIHMLDLARVFFGEATRVSCETQRRNPAVRAEDTATMLLRHAGGAVSIVECTYESRQPFEGRPEVRVTIEGPHGSVSAAPGGREVIVTVGGETTRHLVATDGEDLYPASVHNMCAHLLKRVRAGRDAVTSGADNLKTYALAEAAYEAAASGRAVEPQA